MRKREVAIGTVFGYLTVLDEGTTSRKGKRFFLCRCVCGNERMVQANNLFSGNSKSCYAKNCPVRTAAVDKQRLAPGQQAANVIWHNYKTVHPRKYKHRAFHLTFEQFLQITQSNCYYCGKPPSNKTKDRNSDSYFIYNGIDRLDSQLPYTENNVVPCCKTCNTMKSDQTLDDFREHILILAERIQKGEILVEGCLPRFIFR